MPANRRRAYLESIGANPRLANKINEDEEDDIEVEADATEDMDTSSDTDVEASIMELIRTAKEDGMLSNVTIEDDDAGADEDYDEDFDEDEDLDEEEEDIDEEEDDSEDDSLDEARKARAKRIAEAKALYSNAVAGRIFFCRKG